ncbi:membrane-bound O-acyltransferase family protein, partial [Aliarcobacter cryaerophilus]
MLFNSYEFIFLFLPITFILYFYLLSQRLILGAKIFLVIASLFFYGYWNFSYVPLILLSIFVNYSVGLSLVNHEKIKVNSKTILIFGILFNVGLLGYFKYT